MRTGLGCCANRAARKAVQNGDGFPRPLKTRKTSRYGSAPTTSDRRELSPRARECRCTQVLQEVYVNIARKISRPLTTTSAREFVDLYAAWRPIGVTVPIILAASATERRLQLSLWGSLILEAAKAQGAAALLSEDFQHGRAYDGVMVTNPLLDP